MGESARETDNLKQVLDFKGGTECSTGNLGDSSNDGFYSDGFHAESGAGLGEESTERKRFKKESELVLENKGSDVNTGISIKDDILGSSSMNSPSGSKKSPKEEYSFKSITKSITKMRNELGQINASIMANEKLYKSSLLSNKFIGNLFDSFVPFISGINRFTVKSESRNPLIGKPGDGLTATNTKGIHEREYLKYSTQWYLLAKRRNAELATQNGGFMGNNVNQGTLSVEIGRIEQTVKFRLGLQSEKSLFQHKRGSDPTT